MLINGKSYKKVKDEERWEHVSETGYTFFVDHSGRGTWVAGVEVNGKVNHIVVCNNKQQACEEANELFNNRNPNK